MEILARPQFTWEAQQRFAQLAGDRNPLHVDALAARRSKTGGLTVHGVHTVLQCLEALAKSPRRPASIGSIKVRFNSPIIVGDTADIGLIASDDREARLQVEVGGGKVTTVRVTPAKAADPVEEPPPAPPAIPLLTAPRELAFSELAGRSGWVDGAQDAVEFAKVFPAAAQWLGGDRLRSLALLSRLVGMECPGLRSLFSGFSVDFRPDRGAAIHYTVASADERFHLVQMGVEGAGLGGTVDAFFPPPPAKQPSTATIAKSVHPGEFAGQTALIIGGSRGLGEVAAKILAAGGAHPIVTYARGAADAEAVASDIRNSGGSCDVMEYDARRPAAPQLAALPRLPGTVYYFATGPIFNRTGRLYGRERFLDFFALYVEGFLDLCTSLAAKSPAEFAAFYPSSTALDERPRDMTEYAMAKAAGEVLCADLAAADKKIAIVSRRLPRIETDQTASMMHTESANAVDVLLPMIREVQTRSAK